MIPINKFDNVGSINTRNGVVVIGLQLVLSLIITLNQTPDIHRRYLEADIYSENTHKPNCGGVNSRSTKDRLYPDFNVWFYHYTPAAHQNLIIPNRGDVPEKLGNVINPWVSVFNSSHL